MKQVFDISTVAHLWANQLQDSARNSGNNFYFEGNTIYSYGRHFQIAKHVTNEAGEKAVLFTERRYSNTTAKQVSVVRGAANHLNRIYVPDPANSPTGNFNSWISEAEEIGANLIKAKKPEKYLIELAQLSARVNKYVTFFSLSIPETLQAVLSISEKSQFAEYKDKKEAFAAAEKLKNEKLLAARHKKELAEWKKGKTSRLYIRDGFDYLRLNGERIETTQAVVIPFELGKKIWQKVKADTLTVGSKVLDYSVNEVGNEIRIGCHTFKKSYLVKFGEKIFSI